MLGLLAASDDSGGGAVLTILLVLFVFWIFVVIGWWKIFEKAGEAGWKALIPIYNVIVLLRIVGRPWWWVLLLLLPLVGFVVLIIMYVDLSNSFRKSTGFTLGLIFLHPIFVLILGFGDSQYVGPTTAAGSAPGQPLPPPTV